MADEMEGAVSGEERDLLGERPLPPARLALHAVASDDDVTDTEPAVGVSRQTCRGDGVARALRQNLAEGEHVGGPVDPAVAPVQLPHTRLVHEGDRELRIGRQRDVRERGSDGGASERKVARRASDDAESQLERAAPRVGSWAMRSSG